MGWAEVRRRYRRTLIGPFWSSLSLGVFVGTMGILYATLWKQAPETYLPFLCSGMISWVLISGLLTEGCSTFIASTALLTQMRFNCATLACSVVWRSIATFGHNMAVYLVLALSLGVEINLNTLFIIPGLAIVAINGIWVAITLGMICARFRDIQQVVSSLLQIAMFVTPIFWAPEQLGAHGRMFSDINVLYHLVNLLRAPLLGQVPTSLNIAVGLGVAVVGWAGTYILFRRLHNRLVYWL